MPPTGHLLKFKLYQHLVVITTLARGQPPLKCAQWKRVVQRQTRPVESRPGCSRNTFLTDLWKEFVSSTPVRLSDSPCAPRWTLQHLSQLALIWSELLMYSLKRISMKADTIQQRSTASVLAFPHGGQADPHSITGLSYLGYSKEEHLAKILSVYCFSLHSF